MKKVIILLLFCIHWANTIASVYDHVKLVPHPRAVDANAFVSNPDGILDGETVQSLNAQLYELEKETSAEIALVAVNSIGNQEIEDFSNSLFNRWGIGKADSDNGVLILFVLDQRAIRFEIGYGLEGALPDAICKRIQTQVMIPEFKNENYDAGIMAGVDMMIKIIKEEPVPELTSDDNNRNFFIWTTVILFVLFGLLPWLWLSYNGKRIIGDKKHQTNASRYTAFNSSKNSTFGCLFFLLVPILFFVLFTALFISWKVLLLVLVPLLAAILPVNIWAKQKMKKIRQAPIPCNVCGGTMLILPKTENSHNLNSSQQFEQQLRSVDYDVFKCENCQKKEVFKFESSSEKYSVCSTCGTKSSVKKNQKTIKRPTYSSSDMREVEYTCLFCQYKKTKQEVIPRLRHSSSSGSSSSRSRSSGGSFGGGRSGGGGSTSRW